MGTLLLQLASQARPGQQPLTHVFLDLAGMMELGLPQVHSTGLVWKERSEFIQLVLAILC